MTKLLAAVRACYGAVLLIAPASLLAKLSRAPVDRRARLVARVLGVRELVQAELTRRHPTRRRQLAGAGVDAVHAASMVALARADPARRRLALHDATTAIVLAGIAVGLPGGRSHGDS